MPKIGRLWAIEFTVAFPYVRSHVDILRLHLEGVLILRRSCRFINSGRNISSDFLPDIPSSAL